MNKHNNTNPDFPPDLPPELASLDTALSELAASDRERAPEALASRTLLKTNSIIASAQPTQAAPAGFMESKWKPLLRVAAAVLLLGAVGTVAVLGLRTQPAPVQLVAADNLNSIAIELDAWLMRGELFTDGELAQELASLEDKLESIGPADDISLDLSDEDFAL